MARTLDCFQVGGAGVGKVKRLRIARVHGFLSWGRPMKPQPTSWRVSASRHGRSWNTLASIACVCTAGRRGGKSMWRAESSTTSAMAQVVQVLRHSILPLSQRPGEPAAGERLRFALPAPPAQTTDPNLEPPNGTFGRHMKTSDLLSLLAVHSARRTLTRKPELPAACSMRVTRRAGAPIGSDPPTDREGAHPSRWARWAAVNIRDETSCA